MECRCSYCGRKVPKEVIELFEKEIKRIWGVDLKLETILCPDCFALISAAVEADRIARLHEKQRGEGDD